MLFTLRYNNDGFSGGVNRDSFAIVRAASVGEIYPLQKRYAKRAIEFFQIELRFFDKVESNEFSLSCVVSGVSYQQV